MPGEGLFAIASRQCPSPGPSLRSGPPSPARGERKSACGSAPIQLRYDDVRARALPAAHLVILVGIAELEEGFLRMVAHHGDPGSARAGAAGEVMIGGVMQSDLRTEE